MIQQDQQCLWQHHCLIRLHTVHNCNDPKKDDTAIIAPIAIGYIVGAIDNIY